ncbi:MAG: Flp pilus assembly protein CpaB [Boseongicola sp.]|nr:Flp pilus assembly protein CpaB [Boseongicola sp.]
MRGSTILSFLVAVVLAGLAVLGARDLLLAERQELLALNSTQQAQPAPLVVEEEPKLTIVVADEALRFGERLTPDRLRTIEWASDQIPNGAFMTVEELVPSQEEDDARFVVSSMEQGEPVLATKITEPGVRAKMSTALTPGMKAITIRVNDVLGVAGFVLPGDRVDVMLTRSSRESGQYVDVLMQGVRVLAIDQITDDRKDDPSVVRTVTFEVNTHEAQKLVLAGNVGTLSLALRNIGSSEIETIERVTITDLGDPDVADDLIRQPTEEELAEAARLAALEESLKSLTEGFAQRFNQVEALLDDTDTEVQENVVQVPQRVSSRATVGVTRNGQRSEYRVGLEEEITQ